MRLANETVVADDLSTGWLTTLRAVDAAPGHCVFHQVTRIREPLREDARTRAVADDLLLALELAPIETVAATIFPAAMARQTPEPEMLAERYRTAYPRLRGFPKNKDGTYFGRLVDHPETSTPDQLNDLVRKLRQEKAKREKAKRGGPLSARYEVVMPGGNQLPCDEDGLSVERDDRDTDDYPDEPGGMAVPIAAVKDRVPMRFPCLSLCSFQLDHDHLHLVAHYRSQYLVQRGYGNYLGLGRLLGYVARASELATGELMIVAGYVSVDGRRRAVTKALAAAAELG